jgi:hypothetical protein
MIQLGTGTSIATWPHVTTVSAIGCSSLTGPVRPLSVPTLAAREQHDFGKLTIPDRMLDKPGALTSEEYDHVDGSAR